MEGKLTEPTAGKPATKIGGQAETRNEEILKESNYDLESWLVSERLRCCKEMPEKEKIHRKDKK